MAEENYLSKHQIYHIKCIVAAGSITCGFSFYGPFPNDAEARVWAMDNIVPRIDWTVLPFSDVTNKEQNNG